MIIPNLWENKKRFQTTNQYDNLLSPELRTICHPGCGSAEGLGRWRPTRTTPVIAAVFFLRIGREPGVTGEAD